MFDSLTKFQDNIDIINCLLDSFLNILKPIYVFIDQQFLSQIANGTLMIIKNPILKDSGKLAIELWTTLCEIELDKISRGEDCIGIINTCYTQIFSILT